MLLSANILQPLIDVFEAVLKFFHDDVGTGWGLSIVLLTIVIRAALVPLTLRQMHSMRAMQQLSPQMKAIQERYKEDKQRQQQEMMKFYKENNINPLASCLPMLAQLPVFYSLFFLLRKNLRHDMCGQVQHVWEFGGTYQGITVGKHPGHTIACVSHGFHASNAGFLFVKDLTNTAHGAVLVVLILLYVGTQFASTYLMQMQTPTMDQTQRRLMLFMPLIFVIFILRFPAGVIVYWITTNSWTMAQQYIIRRRIGPPPVQAVVEDPKKRGGRASSSSKGRATANGSSTSLSKDVDGKSSRVKPDSGSGKNGAANGSAGKPAETKSGGRVRSKGSSKAVEAKSDAPAKTSNGKPSGSAPPPPPRKKRKRSGKR